jgi:4-amino-4-deoxy-L-arabinose transferase-like glycosyltransferase
VLRVAALLLCATLLATLPQAGLQDWTGTEGRRVQIALEMRDSGEWGVPTLFGEPTFAKPPLHYWLLLGFAEAFGDGYVALRLPSILLLWGLALLAYGLHRRAFGEGAAWVAALGVVCAPIVVVEFPTAEIDPVFASLTAGSLWLLSFGVAREHRAALFWSGVLGGLALLAKGPPYFVFALGAWLVWWRRRRLRGFWAHALPLALLPGLYYAWLLLGSVGAQHLSGVAGDETVGRLFAYEWKHVADVPSFLLRAVLVQVPLVFWCFWEFRSTRDARMGPADLTLRMCSGAAVLAVFVLALFPGKPTRYLLPNVPLFTFAVAPAVAHYAMHCPSLGRVARGMLRAISVTGALGLVALPFWPSPLPERTGMLLLVAALVPALVRTPRALVAMCFLLPVLAAWTAVADHGDRWVAGPRARAVHGDLLFQELSRLPDADGLAVKYVECFGHVHGGLVLGTGFPHPPKGHEAALRQPTAPWVLREAARHPPLPELVEYREVLRLCLPGQVFVVEQRERK